MARAELIQLAIRAADNFAVIRVEHAILNLRPEAVVRGKDVLDLLPYVAKDGTVTASEVSVWLITAARGMRRCPSKAYGTG
jgi:hypothetical protein